MNKKNFLFLILFFSQLSGFLFAQTDSNISDKELMKQMAQARSAQGKTFSKEFSDTVPSIVKEENLQNFPTDSTSDPKAQMFKDGTAKQFSLDGDNDSLTSKMKEQFKGFNFGGNGGGQNFNLFNFGKMFGGSESDTSKQNFQGFSFDGQNFKQFGNMDTALLNQFKKQMQGFSFNFGDADGMKNFQMPENMKEQLQKSFGGMGGFPNSSDNKQFGQKHSPADKLNGKKKDYKTESF